MTLPASALPVEAPPAFLGVAQSVTGKLWRDRLDARGAARALAIVQRYQLPEMLARVLARPPRRSWHGTCGTAGSIR